MNGRKVGNSSRIKDGYGRLALGKYELQRVWKDYFYYIETQEQVAVHMCNFDGVQRSKYFGGNSIRKTEVEVRVEIFKNRKVVGKDAVSREMIKNGGNMVVEWIWSLCNMVVESGVVPEN